MRTFDVALGGRPVAVHAPEIGSFDPEAFRAAFPPGALYGLDVEGTYMDKYLGQFAPGFRVRLVQFATADYAWVLTLEDPDQQAAAVELLTDERVSFCSHSNMDVLSVAVEFGVDITGRNVDTRMLAVMADPDKDDDRDLKTLTTKYIGPELEAADGLLGARFTELWALTGQRKNTKKEIIEAHGWSTIPSDDPVYLTYAGLDAIACRRLADLLVPETQAPAELLRMEQFLATRANRIQLRGCKVDQDRLAALWTEAQDETDEAKAEFTEVTGVNPLSPQKMQDWFSHHGVDWSTWEGKLTETGNPSLAKDNVLLLRTYPLDAVAQRALEALVRFKGKQDMRTKTDAVKKHLAADGRLHPKLHPLGASTTGRMSAAGPNFQNFSKKDPRVRGLFVPEDGHTFVTIDFDQVELRVVAALAREQKMIDTILAGGDLHQLTADELAENGVIIDRDTAKMTNFLIVYGGGAPALQEQGGIPLEEAQRIVGSFRDRYPAITRLAKELGWEREAVRTISGRRLPVTVVRGNGPRAGDLRSYANINYVVQSSARELLVDAWWRLDQEFGHGAMVWFPIHDELVLQVPTDRVAQVIEDAQRCMRFDFMGVPISATAIELIDENGDSRWMTSKTAEKNAKARAAA